MDCNNSGYSQNGHPHEALAFFNEMQVQGIKPNSITIVSVLPVCADLLALEQVSRSMVMQ
jgi:pentatricopeptide repeat protein